MNYHIKFTSFYATCLNIISLTSLLLYYDAVAPSPIDVLAEVASSPSAFMNDGSNGPESYSNGNDDNNRSNAVLWPNKVYPKRRNVVRPPMVDSNLLRFLAKQKPVQKQAGQSQAYLDVPEDDGTSSASVNNSDSDQQQQSLALSNAPAAPFVSPTNGYLTSLSQEDEATTIAPASDTAPTTFSPLSQQQELSLQPPSLISQQQQQEAEQQQQLEQVDDSDSLVDFDDSNSLVDSSGLGQFNRYRIASMLRTTLATDSSSNNDNNMSGEDEALFCLAGERVQSQALARTARRRVREFLKERDQAWTADSIPIAAPSERAAAPSSTSPALYGVQDVVDVMISFGLTAKDIAEIFVHSPGIALMRPQHAQQQVDEIEADVDASVSAESISAAAVEPKEKEEDGTNDHNGETLQETLDRSLVGLLCGTLGLRKYDARKVLRNCPGLLTMRGSRSAEQVIMLLSRLGVSANSIARDKNALPTLLSRSPAALFRLIAFLASDAVRMPMNKIGPLLRRSECQELLDMVAPVPVFDSNTDDVVQGKYNDGTTDPGVVAALWGQSSQVRRERINEVYRNMTKTASTLRNEIGTEDLGKVISAYPKVLLLDAEEQILPTANYLMNELGVWEDDLPRVLQLYPALLGMEISQMEQVAAFLLDLEVGPETLSSIFRSFPAILTLDIEMTMVPVVDFLKSKAEIANVGRFISRLPPILGYSVPNELQPKWEFLESIVSDARYELSRFPAYFSYPLERVEARFDYLRNVKQVPVQLLGLDKVLRFGDKDFAIKVAADRDFGKAFRAFTQDRKQAAAAGVRKKSTKQRAPKRKQAPQQSNSYNKVL
jgi:hypothetical protein